MPEQIYTALWILFKCKGWYIQIERRVCGRKNNVWKIVGEAVPNEHQVA